MSVASIVPSRIGTISAWQRMPSFSTVAVSIGTGALCTGEAVRSCAADGANARSMTAPTHAAPLSRVTRRFTSVPPATGGQYNLRALTEGGMRLRHGIAILVAVAALAAAFLAGTILPVAGQGQNSGLPRSPDGTPDFSGIWQAVNT